MGAGAEMLRRLSVQLIVAALLLAEYLAIPGPGAILWVAATVVLGGAVVAYLVTSPRTQLVVPTIYRGPATEARIAFTFDDGPDPGFTAQILDVLREFGAKATFFVVGRCADAHPELLVRTAREGHLIGSHTYSHANTFHVWPPRRMAADIARGIETIERVVGTRPRYFRPPQGLRVPPLREALASLAEPLSCVTWTVRGLDTVSRSAVAIVARVERRLEAGAIVALHDGSSLGGYRDRSATIEALRALLRMCRERGLTCVRLDELLGPAPDAAAGPLRAAR
jgi:peptidoglycan/xylan/chitin deacetylase (PgdA/CDA1 family)